MGCAFQGITQFPYQEHYLQLRQTLDSTPQFRFLNHFYFEIWNAANRLLQASSQFEDIRTVHSRVVQLQEDIELLYPLKPLSLVLSTFTDHLYPFIKEAEPNLTYSFKTASQFVARYAYFAKEVEDFFYLKKAVQDKKTALVDGEHRFWSGKLLLLYFYEKMQQHCEGIQPVNMNFTPMNQFFMLLECALFTGKSLTQIEKILASKHKFTRFTVKQRLIECMSDHQITCDVLRGCVQQMLQISQALKEKYESAQMAEVPFRIDFPELSLPPKGWLNISVYQRKGKVGVKQSLPEMWVNEHRGDPPPTPKKLSKESIQFQMETTSAQKSI